MSLDMGDILFTVGTFKVPIPKLLPP